MTNTIPAREDVYVPHDDAANQIAAAAAAERVRQEFKTKRLIINWSFVFGIVFLFFATVTVAGLSQ